MSRYDDGDTRQDLMADGREVPPMCEAITERRVICGKEKIFVCGGQPDYTCAHPQCRQPICEQHVVLCAECEDDFHEECLVIEDGRRVCIPCAYMGNKHVAEPVREVRNDFMRVA
jgi:hypothetical protein